MANVEQTCLYRKIKQHAHILKTPKKTLNFWLSIANMLTSSVIVGLINDGRQY